MVKYRIVDFMTNTKRTDSVLLRETSTRLAVWRSSSDGTGGSRGME